MDDPSQHHTWVNPDKARYYQVHLGQDLLGDWTLLKVWGGLCSRRGGMHNIGVASYEDGLEQIREIAKRRTQHGYRPPPPRPRLDENAAMDLRSVPGDSHRNRGRQQEGQSAD